MGRNEEAVDGGPGGPAERRAFALPVFLLLETIRQGGSASGTTKRERRQSLTLDPPPPPQISLGC